MIPLRDRNRSRTLPVVTILLIIANVIVFFIELNAGPELEDLIRAHAVMPRGVTLMLRNGGVGAGEQAWRVLAAMFLHGGWLHLIGNMWFLWIFGDNVEDRIGHPQFLLFYLAGGVAATLTHVLMLPHDTHFLIGASGAVAAVLGAYAVTFPDARVLTLVPFFFLWLVELPALVVLGLWFMFQLMRSLAEPVAPYGGVAWWAHVGGFLFGALIFPFIPRRRGLRSSRRY